MARQSTVDGTRWRWVLASAEPGRRTQRERGETLIELLIAMMVLGIAVVAVLGGLAVAIRMSGLHRQQATVGAYLRDFAEALQRKIDAPTTGYVPCASTTDYASAYTAPSPFVNYFVGDITVWDGSSQFVSKASPCNDKGIQKITIGVRDADNKVSETLDIVLRLPCRPTECDHP